MIRTILSTIIMLLCAAVQAATIIPSSRIVPWQTNIGVLGGIPNSAAMTIYKVMPNTSTRAQVETEAGNCPSNQVLLLTNGTFSSWGSGNLDGANIGSGVVIKGMTNANGYPTTIIPSSAMTVLIRPGAGFNEALLSTEVSLSADANKDAVTLSCTIPSWAAPGNYIGIDQLDDTSLSFNPGQEAGTSYRQIMGNGARGMAQLLRVIATNGTTITFDMPLAWTFTTANTAQIFQPGGVSFKQRIGIEDILFTHTGAAATDNHMFKFENSANCWLKNVHGSNLVGGIYVLGQFSVRCEIRHCRFDDCKSLGGGQAYGVGLYNLCTGWLTEDNIFRKLHVAMQNNYGSCINVFSLNFETDGQSDSGQNPGMSTHGTTGYMSLFEGNWCMDKFLGDFTHGAGCYYTVHRNRIVGKNPAQSNDQTAFSNEKYNRQINAVGNMLGDATWHTNYLVAPGSSQWTNSIATCSDKSIYKLGYWANIGCSTGTGTEDFATMNPIIAVSYDTVTATNSGIVLGGFATSDLVTSYYRSSKPSWMRNWQPWPVYGPDVGSSAAKLSETNLSAGHRFVFNADPSDSAGGGGSGGADTKQGPGMKGLRGL